MAKQQEVEIMTRMGKQKVNTDKVIYFPRGLMGFEHEHEFTLLQIKPGAPFLLLQSMNDPELGLLVADPYSFIEDYPIRIGDAEQLLLCIKSAEQVAALVTASIPHGKPDLATLNLTGPILINHEAKLAVQVPQIDGNYPANWRVSGEKDSE